MTNTSATTETEKSPRVSCAVITPVRIRIIMAITVVTTTAPRTTTETRIPVAASDVTRVVTALGISADATVPAPAA